MMVALLLALSLRLVPNAPSFNVFGPGPVFNVFRGDEQADTNALAHVWFGMACPLAIHTWGGVKMWKSGAICAGASLTREIFFHGQTPGPEIRTDLASTLGSIGLTVGLDYLLHDHR